jgi:hypothetical protein
VPLLQSGDDKDDASNRSGYECSDDPRQGFHCIASRDACGIA